MPRPQKWPPTITIHKASGQARIRVRGKDYYLGRPGTAEARREYARLLVELANHAEPQPVAISTTPTVVEVCAHFLRGAAQRYTTRGGQVIRFRRALDVVQEVHGTLAASVFGAVQLRDIQAAMAGRGWCANTVNRHIIRIRTAWRWLEEQDRLVPPGSWAALCVVSPLRANHPLYRPAPQRDRVTGLDAVRAVCRELPDVPRAALLLLFWTGARPGEICIMQAEDVDRATWVYRPKRHKNDWRGHDRLIPIGPKGRAVLLPWLDACTEPTDYVFPPTPCRRRGAAGRLVEHARDEYDRTRCYTTTALDQAIRRSSRRAGCPGFFAYLCRHTARMRLSRLAGDEAARAVLGQKDLSTTLGYGQLDAELARDAATRHG